MYESKRRNIQLDWALKGINEMPAEEVLSNPDAGKFTSIIATMNVIDHDDDVVLTESIGRQDAAISYWAHGWNKPCVGRGVVYEDGNALKAEGEFLLSTSMGRDHYFAVRMMKELQEWSFGLDVIQQQWELRDHIEVRLLQKINVIEFTPCLRGASIGSMTLDIKALSGVDLKSGQPHFIPTSVLKARRHAEQEAARIAEQQVLVAQLKKNLTIAA